MVVGDVTTAVDVLVLGAGPAGYVAAIRSAQLGKKVTLVNQGPEGGVCLNSGCIPLKALLSSSARFWQAQPQQLTSMGIAAESVTFDWAAMQAWKQNIVKRLSEGVRRLLAGNAVDIIQGKGWFINAQEMRVEGEYGSHRLKFGACIIATGAQPAPSNSFPYNADQALTPEQALALPTLPSTLSVAGDDYIALEVATLFARLGVNVKLFTPTEHILSGFDPAALRFVQVGLRKLGMQVTTKTPVASIQDRPLVVSNGARPRTAELRLDAAGVHVHPGGGIAVNTMQQTSNPAIYAAGDCTGSPPLASIAIKQGKVAAEALAGRRVQFAPLVTPLVVHTTPEIAAVGYSAEEAIRAGYKVVTGRFPLAANGRALTLGSDAGVALLVASAGDETLLGATLVAPQASDLIAQLALAIEMGATLTDLAEIIYAHPSLSETIQESAENALERAIHILPKM